MTETTIKSDIGVDFEIVVKEDGVVVDISAATAIAIEFQKPGGARIEKTAVLSTDGTDGKLRYRTLAADELDELGKWNYRGIVTFSAALVYRTQPAEVFEVVA